MNNITIGPQCKKTCPRGFANNTGADQPAHLRSLICASIIRLFKSIISRLATSKISIFRLITVAEQVGLNLFIRNPENRFCHAKAEAHMFVYRPSNMIFTSFFCELGHHYYPMKFNRGVI